MTKSHEQWDGKLCTYRREDVGDDVDGGADECGAEDDEEGQLGVKEVVPPRALVREGGRDLSFSKSQRC